MTSKSKSELTLRHGVHHYYKVAHQPPAPPRSSAVSPQLLVRWTQNLFVDLRWRCLQSQSNILSGYHLNFIEGRNIEKKSAARRPVMPAQLVQARTTTHKTKTRIFKTFSNQNVLTIQKGREKRKELTVCLSFKIQDITRWWRETWYCSHVRAA